MSNNGSHQAAKTHCPKGHPYDESNTRLYTHPKRQQTQRVCIACSKIRARAYQLKQYGISEEEYERLYQEQDGVCAIVGCESRATDIDHNHNTGQARGLLCNPHNMALGLFGDSPGLLREAAQYLEGRDA